MTVDATTATPASDEPADLRFDRLRLLVGDEGLGLLRRSRVMVVGVGGVGSWAAEALVRSGVGAVTLVDFDVVCATNVNRQVHALDGVIGQPKAVVMAARLRAINPAAEIRASAQFYDGGTAAAILAESPDYVIDAIDCIASKCHLLAQCRDRGLPVVCSTGAGGRMDPGQIAVGDLAETDVDPLARAVRKGLRRDHGFPREGAFGIEAVFSREEPAAARDRPLGTAVFVTGTFGFRCAACVVRGLLQSAGRRG